MKNNKILLSILILTLAGCAKLDSGATNETVSTVTNTSFETESTLEAPTPALLDQQVLINTGNAHTDGL